MIIEQSGGRRAIVISKYHRWLYKLGFYRPYTQIDWAKVDRLVFVCMGNINRSAYGDAKAKAMGLESISYGIDADEEKGASIEAIRNAGARGIDLAGHNCRSLKNIELKSGDLVLAVEPAHLDCVQRRIDENNAHRVPVQITLLGIWANTPTPFLQDPICRSDVYFASCFALIDQAVSRIAKKTRGSRADDMPTSSGQPLQS